MTIADLYEASLFTPYHATSTDFYQSFLVGLLCAVMAFVVTMFMVNVFMVNIDNFFAKFFPNRDKDYGITYSILGICFFAMACGFSVMSYDFSKSVETNMAIMRGSDYQVSFTAKAEGKDVEIIMKPNQVSVHGIAVVKDRVLFRIDWDNAVTYAKNNNVTIMAGDHQPLALNP